MESIGVGPPSDAACGRPAVRLPERLSNFPKREDRDEADEGVAERVDGNEYVDRPPSEEVEVVEA